MSAPTVIEDIRARKIFNSRGEETIEIDVITWGGFGRASAPTGKSKGKHEVASYPEGEVDRAVREVEEVIAPELIGMNADEQQVVDMLLHEIDGTSNFKNIGGNTAYAISMAIAEAASATRGIPLFQQLAGTFVSELPCPLGNVLGGGKHAGRNAPDIQEFLTLPTGVDSFSEAAEANVRIHEGVGHLIEKTDNSFVGGRGDEGAWTPNLGNEEALEIVSKACETVSDELGIEVGIGLDIAASSFWDPNKKQYVYSRDKVKRDQGEQIDFLLGLIKKYHLIYVEDPLHEEDFDGFADLTRKAKECLICGDDLFTTSRERLSRGIKLKAANAIIIKPNQIGTLTDAYEAVKMAKRAHYVPVASHRSGESVDAHLAHTAVAFGCPIIKTGVVGGERVAKINELLRIEEALGNRAKMAEIHIGS